MRWWSSGYDMGLPSLWLGFEATLFNVIVGLGLRKSRPAQLKMKYPIKAESHDMSINSDGKLFYLLTYFIIFHNKSNFIVLHFLFVLF